MQKLIKMIKNNKIKAIIIGLIAIIILILGINSRTIVTRISELFNKEELQELSYKTYELSESTGKALITFRSEQGITELHYPHEDGEEESIVYSKGKTSISIDYEMEDLQTYTFKAVLKNGATKEYNVEYEIPRIKGNYKLVDGVYVNEPDVTEGFDKTRTRYMYMNAEGNLVPGNWITDEAPDEWYNYKTQEWANIYVESSGVESYYVWIPRYVYKKDTTSSISGNERMDIKFVNTYNQYINGETNQVITWNELQTLGYQLPEAFKWNYSEDNVDIIIPGYWMSKYELSTLGSYVINYNMVATKAKIQVSNFTTNTTKTIAKYTYAINGQIVNRSETLDNYDFINTTPDKNNVINVTALDENGCIIGSMTKELELTEANPPDLTGFDKDMTFYVYWDEAGNEHNEIPISMDPPEDWYNYSYASWANIVSRANGVETYLVWIPRYQYSLDGTAQRSNVSFIIGTGTDTKVGYQIPEAFTWDGKEIPGYWMTKYELSLQETNPRITTELAAGGTSIKVKDITGTLIEAALTDGTNVKYEYYINGIKKNEGNSNTENYVFTDLELNKEYAINIIARNADTDKYIGAITKKITTKEVNEPDLTGFDKATTYYVTFNDDGTEKERKLISENEPTDWYDYENNKWANIVTTGNDTTSYFVWIPRYEYRILTNTNISAAIRRSEVNFITTSITNDNATSGYQVPEAFTWTNAAGETVQIPGYWMSKYELSN